MANTSLDLVSLDIPTLETSLKTYLRSQSLFKDYDFDGSNMAALVRILALNTHKNGYFLNMINAEGYLDSAQTRSAVLSHAKELNYVPRSAKSANAQVTVTFTGTNSAYVINKGVTFSSVVNNRGLVFSVPTSLLLSSPNGSFSFTTSVQEGRYVTDSYVMNASNTIQRFILSNPQIDTDSLTVVVYESGQTIGATYVQSATLLDVNAASNVYFLQASDLGQYEVIFGDSVVGHRPSDGASITFDYRVTVGDLGNGASVFNRDWDLGPGTSNFQITTLANSAGGATPETNDSIKYYAPRHFQVQQRAVVASDYTILLKSQFPEIAAVSAYGGEDANPPRYGKVIVAVSISNVDGIPESKRDEYYSFLKGRTGLTVEPIFVVPNYTYASITSVVRYNLNLTTITPTNMATIVQSAILSYAGTYLDDFAKILRYSRLASTIDGSQTAIVGSQTDVRVYKKASVVAGSPQSFTLAFNMPLYTAYPEAGAAFPVGDLRTVRSGTFTVSGEIRYVTDDGVGNLWIAVDRGPTTVLLQQVGTVDYTVGFLNVVNLSFDASPGPILKFYARTATQDVVTQQDTILQVEPSEVNVTAVTVRE